MMKKSNGLALLSLLPGAAAAAFLYWYDETFPWLLYLGVGAGVACGAYSSFLEMAANRKIVDRS